MAPLARTEKWRQVKYILGYVYLRETIYIGTSDIIYTTKGEMSSICEQFLAV